MAMGIKGGEIITAEVEGETEAKDAETLKAFIEDNI